MKRHNLHAIAAAVGLLVAGQATLAQTQAPKEMDAVTVTGIRASIQKSIEAKRNADTNVEVVSAEDVGKMPDKNIADALSRLSGVNVQYGGANAMDEAERVSIRGTSPNLNLITVNGHALSSGDWHVGDQQAANSVSSRSVGFGLLPSQLIGQSVVYKTQRADLTEGGLAGSVDVSLRKPLDFAKHLNAEVSLGAVYSDLPGKTDPQASGILAWKSDDKTLGLMVQGFKEDRTLRRDGMETLGYTGGLTAAQVGTQTNLIGLRMPNTLNATLFEGDRKRTGGYAALQFKPNADLDATVSIFNSKMTAQNYNSSAYSIAANLLNNGWQIQNAVVSGDTVVSGKLVRPANAPASQQIVGMQFEHFLRDGASAEANFKDLDLKYRVSEKLKSRVRIGSTDGVGTTTSQPSIYTVLINPNMSWNVTSGRPADWQMLDSVTGKPLALSDMKNWQYLMGAGAAVYAKDKEDYLHLDGDYEVGASWLSTLKFGLRSSKHERTVDNIAARYYVQDDANGNPITTPASYGTVVTGGTLLPFPLPTPPSLYPSNYGNALDANYPRDAFRFDVSQLTAFANKYIYWDPVKGKNWGATYGLTEKNNAAYVMGEFENGPVSGNFGLRYAQTQVDTVAYQLLTSGTAAGQCVPMQPCSVPGAIVGSRQGTYVPQATTITHTNVLPSLNLRWDLDQSLIGRFALSRSMGRPNYNEMAAAVSLDNIRGTGTTGNPYLKPIMSTNIDASLAWYFAPRAYVSGGVFKADLQNYVKPRTSTLSFLDTNTGLMRDYLVSTRDGVDASLNGFELAAEIPVGAGFGVGGNYTYVNTNDADSQPMMGASKNTYTVVAFYENNDFSARVGWNFRDDYAYNIIGNGSGIPTKDAAGNITVYNGLHYWKGYGALSLSLGYKISKDISITLDGNNLNNPVRHTYQLNENAPTNWYVSGAQYYLNLRMKL